jgi:hypothetical protein
MDPVIFVPFVNIFCYIAGKNITIFAINYTNINGPLLAAAPASAVFSLAKLLAVSHHNHATPTCLGFLKWQLLLHKVYFH